MALILLGGDLSGSEDSPVVETVGGELAADIATAVSVAKGGIGNGLTGGGGPAIAVLGDVTTGGDTASVAVSANGVGVDVTTLNGDHLTLDFTPTNYTPDTAPAEADDVDDLAAHLKGIDSALLGLQNLSTTLTAGNSTGASDISVDAGQKISFAGAVLLGGSATGAGATSVSVGNSASAGHADAIAIGNGATTFGTNQVVIGSPTSPVTLLVLGGDTHTASPGDLTLRLTDIVTTADTAGPSLVIRSGGGTGTGASSSITLQTPTTTVSGSAQQVFSDSLILSQAGSESLAIGCTLAASSTGDQSVVIGSNATSDQISAVVIGRNAAANTGGSCVAIGDSASVGTQSVSIGVSSSAGSNSSVAIGNLAASTSAGGVAVGGGATVGSNGRIALGFFASAQFSNSMAFGRGATTSAIRQLVMGAQSFPLTEAVIGYGPTISLTGALTDLTVRSSDRDTVTDESGQNLVIRSGNGTGSSTATSVVVQTPTTGTTGTTQQSSVTRLTVDENAVIAAVPLQVPTFAVAGLPSAATAARIIYVSDETGGAVVAFSDGTNWRRVTDRAIVA